MKLRAYCESVAAKWPDVAAKLKTLAEMDGMGDMEMDAPPPMDAGPDDPVKAAISTAMHGLVDQMDAGSIDGPAFITKLKALLKMAEKLKDAPAETDKPAEPDAEKESLKKQLADALKEAADLKLAALIGDTQLSPVQRKAVESLTDEADRKALVESFKQIKPAGQQPKSGEQNGPKKHTESVTVPTDGAKFAEFIR